jgi:hypothetical protein
MIIFGFTGRWMAYKLIDDGAEFDWSSWVVVIET